MECITLAPTVTLSLTLTLTLSLTLSPILTLSLTQEVDAYDERREDERCGHDKLAHYYYIDTETGERSNEPRGLTLTVTLYLNLTLILTLEGLGQPSITRSPVFRGARSDTIQRIQVLLERMDAERRLPLRLVTWVRFGHGPWS